MGAEILSQLYVDVTQRGVESVGVQLRGLQRQADDTTRSVRRMRDEIQNVGQVQARPVLQSGGGGFTNLQTAQRSVTAGITAPPRVGSGTPTPGALDAAGMTRLASSAAVASAAIGGLTAYLTTLGALTRQGFEGTVEIDQFNRAMGQFTRELANVAAPALEMVTGILNGVTDGIRSLGEIGQKMIGRGLFGPLGYLFDIISDPGIQSAMSQLSVAFGQLAQAMRPLWTVSINVANLLMKALVVKPLIDFAEKLTYTLVVMERVTRGLGQMTNSLLRLVGLGGLTRPVDGPRREVRLNQTGNEDATATYQRIQEAVYRAAAGVKEPQDQVVEHLDVIKNKVTGIFDFIESYMNRFGLKMPANAAAVSDTASSVPLAGGLVMGAVIKSMLGKM